MQRIMIIGGPGSGKSTLARQLGARLGLPVIHADHFYWAPGWVMRPAEEIQRDFDTAAQGAAWVFEGNHSASWDTRAARARMIIWLDLPPALLVWRVTRRALSNWGGTRPDMAPGCPERIDADFLRFTWDMRQRRPRFEALLDRWATRKPVHHLRSPRAVRRFLDGFPGH
ncbi:MAG: hypothetical protein GYB53_10460 [Rhodobacteraceae bacterium]|nr:hypothetical protein [Paracoccaceae bacterium]MBR9820262.1 hypothetical protein [Paracoccaceae bacterium]